MSNVIELNPVDFVTVGTIGPKGKRTFHLQAGQDQRIVSFTIEKEQAQALASAISDLLAELEREEGSKTEADFSQLDMDLREPIEPLFRIAQMGLSYEPENKMVILIAQEYVPSEEDLAPSDADEDENEADDVDFSIFDAGPGQPQVVRMWCSREQMLALSLHALDTVKSGRPDAKQNGRIIYYWT